MTDINSELCSMLFDNRPFMKQFNKDSYRDAFDSYREKYRELFDKIESEHQEADDLSIRLHQVGFAFVYYE